MPPTRRRASLAQFLMRWVAGMVLLVTLSVGGLGFATRRANQASGEQYRDALQLQHTFEFEVTALRANVSPSPAAWRRADAALQSLISGGSRFDDLTPVQESYRLLKSVYDPRAPRADETVFLDTLRKYRTGIDVRMRLDQRESTRLDRLALIWSAVLLLLAFAGLIFGGLELWKRVFLPLLALSEVAQRFGQGDLSVRAQVPHRDELGELADTFNNMASTMEEREQERLRFVATVAHDLKNPLVSVGGIAHVLVEKSHKFSPDEQKEWLRRILSGTQRMEALIMDLTDAVQLHTGQVTLRAEPFDLSQVATEALDEAAAAFTRHVFKQKVQPQLFIEADCSRIHRVLSNLLSNAAKYSPSGSEILLTVKQVDDHVLLEVQDQGAGISEADLPRLFAPFTRLSRTEAKVSGTGLGLSSVKKIVEAHGGHISVQSTLDLGSTFTVCLPLKPPIPSANPLPSGSPAS